MPSLRALRFGGRLARSPLPGLSGTDRISTEHVANRPRSVHMNDRCRGDLSSRPLDYSKRAPSGGRYGISPLQPAYKQKDYAHLILLIPTTGQALQILRFGGRPGRSPLQGLSGTDRMAPKSAPHPPAPSPTRREGELAIPGFAHISPSLFMRRVDIGGRGGVWGGGILP